MFCKSCGKQLEEGVKFCDGCGAAIEGGNEAAAPVANPQPAQTVSSTENRVIFMLSYLGILFFLPLVACPDSREGKYHANQGLILLLASFVVGIAIMILNVILFAIGIGFLGALISFVLWVAVILMVILGMVNAYNGKQEPLPVIGSLFTIIK